MTASPAGCNEPSLRPGWLRRAKRKPERSGQVLVRRVGQTFTSPALGARLPRGNIAHRAGGDADHGLSRAGPRAGP